MPDIDISKLGGKMRIEKVRVEGFRLLEDVEIMLEPTSTVIVGRNNSGKTSLTDIFDRFISDSGPSFRLEDFSAGIRGKFIEAKNLRNEGVSLESVLAALPKIVVTLTFRYSIDAPSLGPLSPFVIDLDEKCSAVIVRIEYGPTLATIHTLLDISSPEEGVNETNHFFRCLKDTLPKAYSKQVTAIDPTDESNKRPFDSTAILSALLQCNLVRAQRTLDHAKYGDPDVIGRLLTALFKTATAPNAAIADQELAAQLKVSVETIERDMQNSFDEMLKELLPALEVFGFSCMNDTELRPQTSLNVEALLSDHTKIVYTGPDGVHLPEGYNGLGTRKLIYMLLQLESYHKAYRAKTTRPGVHLIFIEEPEAHLHPQMQEVFIKQLNELIDKFSIKYPQEPVWRVQFILTTHSSHVANAAPFDAIRYFLTEPSAKGELRRTRVKDFKKGVSTIPSEEQKFLHQYMTLTKCDLYFADKAILVEGVTERILMPRLCEIVNSGLSEQYSLARQYVTTIEVGGSYAHFFYPLINFLELKALVITDLDTVKRRVDKDKNGKNVARWVKCPVAEGERTSNIAIQEWFNPKREDGQCDPQESWISTDVLIAKTDAEKINGFMRIAYQVPEQIASGACARSYEDAFILANPNHFKFVGDQDQAIEAWEIAKELPKTETAFRFAIEERDWVVPRYIHEGLIWLSQSPLPLTAIEPTSVKRRSPI